ncbi:unnamed protein product [Lupinus luteus]|uniref:Uncharacterized protein n=1 Tax=Lupinus luteus TaxID=3873 RepID=A0AAV1WUU0_LUPLU
MARFASSVFTFFVILLLLVVTVNCVIVFTTEAKTCYVPGGGSCFGEPYKCPRGCDEAGYDGGRCQNKSFRGNQQGCFCKIKGCVSN